MGAGRYGIIKFTWKREFISEDNISNNDTKNHLEKISIFDDSMFP
jgi:hypothetical protein